MGPPGTALRPPTGLRGLPGTQLRQPTAGGRPASRQGLGPLNTNVQVADRPVTQQGMMGMKVTNQGPGRQVADKSYYMAELRKKCDDLGAEIQKMNNEIEQHNKDNTTYTQMERKYESLIKEVRKLQGDLADYNLIVDKSRTKTDPQDIAAAYQQLKARNDMERRRVDDIFTERQHKEAEIVSVHAKISLSLAMCVHIHVRGIHGTLVLQAASPCAHSTSPLLTECGLFVYAHA
jgi:intraflagellar transport protein 74